MTRQQCSGELLRHDVLNESHVYYRLTHSLWLCERRSFVRWECGKKEMMSRLLGGISHQVILPIVEMEPEYNVYYSQLIIFFPSNMWNASDRQKNGFGPGWNGPGLAFY